MTTDYYDVKRILINYNYHLGRLKSLLLVSQRYKDDPDKFLDEIRLRLRYVRGDLEKVDLKIVANH